MTNETERDASIYGIFTIDEVNQLHDEYKTHLNPNKSLYQIATQIFRHYKVRTIDDVMDFNIASHSLRDDIQTAFFNVQSLVITTDKEKTEYVEHKKGDFIRDVNNEPIPTDDGRDYKKYTKDVSEKVRRVIEVPYFDHKSNLTAWKELERRLKDYEVLPNYDELRRDFLAPETTNFDRGCEIIRNLTNYYIFENPDTFVERFALLICNAKAKALGYHPKYPVLFSLVGKMGVGKSWLAQMVKETHDRSFCCHSGVTSYGRLLGGQFNSMMLTRGFLSIDEAQGLDKAQCEKLKTYITSTTVDIERKGRDVVTCDNLVTFFSTTNESVKDIMGYQPDRRIIEFNILEKTSEIPEEEIRKWLEELWLVMPVTHPHAQEIKDSLLADSNMTLDVKMEEIVHDLFNEHQEIIGTKNLNIHKFKAAIRNMGGIPFARVFDWCADKGIVYRLKDGHVRVSKRTLADFMKNYENESVSTSSVEQEIDNIFNNKKED